MNSLIIFVLILTSIILGLLIYLYIKKSNEYKKLYSRFKDVINIEKETLKVKNQYANMVKNFKKKREEFKSSLLTLKNDYSKKRNLYENLLKEISILEEDIEFISFGIYKPHFDFDTSEEYKERLSEIRSKQKEMIHSKEAALCHTDWSVGGSSAEGRKMTNRGIKLVLRAFNNECDATILKIKWNNVKKMEERIKKAFAALNKLNEPNHIYITESYLQLKLNELYLSHEYEEKLHEEKEEQKRIKEQMREEEKVRREIEKAQQDAEKEEQRYERALDQARSDLKQAHGAEITKLNEKMRLLEEKLREAQENKERALSRAQLTKSGHVYVISNIGSFGKNIYKIGMTRRLEPFDRIRELSDASVPFSFDVHAMIYSQNAPELESELHKVFDKRRLNLVNQRKEFFYAKLDEIEKIVKKNDSKIEFTKLAEAREFRESLSIREKVKLEKQKKEEVEKKFPVAI